MSGRLLGTLRASHAGLCAAGTGPVEQVERCLRALGSAPDPTVWISVVDPSLLRAQAAAQEAALAGDPGLKAKLPLAGSLFAVKDNIDVAGMPTTVGCPAFAYTPERSAAVVERLQAAGALLVGKTNLDQFATGLVGTRSPFGVPCNAFNPEIISGGSSSGSAVAVARGHVHFALGTDTAGSGRVPAGLNNLVGLKPSRGLVSNRGVFPACRSLDCVSILALTVGDALTVLGVLRAFDAEDPGSRRLELAPDTVGANFRFARPRPGQLEFFGDEQARACFERDLALLRELGGEELEIDFQPFLTAAALLYEGPWVAERMAAIDAFYREQGEHIHPVVRTIIGRAPEFSATALFQAEARLDTLRSQLQPLLGSFEALVVPTAPTIYRIDEVLAEPYATNRSLGYYTNFVNLLDLAALAVPCGFRADGVPAGVTLIGPAGSDLALAALGARLQARAAPPLGATGQAWSAAEATMASPRGDTVDVLVVGAHLLGQPLNGQLTERAGRILETTRTSANYRLYALAGTVPAKPGMVRDETAGAALEVELWRLPMSAYGSFVALIGSPLGIGRVELADGRWVQGFLCEAWALKGAREITHLGGWRAYLADISPEENP